MQAGTYFRRREEMLLYFTPLNFRILLASLHAASRARRSCHSVSSWDRSSNFGALWLRWWGSPGQIIPSEGFCLVSSVSVTYKGLCEFYTSGRFPCVWAILEHATQLSFIWWVSIHNRSLSVVMLILLQHSHCTFVTILFRTFCQAVLRLGDAQKSKSATTLGLVEQAYWRMPLFTEWFGASSFEVILAGPSRHSTTGTLASGTLGSRRIFLILPRMKELGEGFGCVDFARLSISWRKLQLSPLEHCPLAFHCQQSPRILCTRCFVPWFLTTAFLS